MKQFTQNTGSYSVRQANSARRTWLLTALIAGAAIALTGCGKQAFVVTSTETAQKAPGSYLIPPKVDILLAEDDTGSMMEAFDSIRTQLPAFLTGLEAKGWDYHFATTPLTTHRYLEILASHHDGNWGNLFTPPYPGAVANGPGTVAPASFRFPEDYTQFLTRDDLNNGLNGYEPGLDTINFSLHNETPNTGFLRDDALLVIVVVGNGDDTSGVTTCYRADSTCPGVIVGSAADHGCRGYTGACEDVGYPQYGTKVSSFNSYKSQLIALKPNANQVKFYSAVAFSQVNNCLGSASRIGTRYKQMAAALGGASYDICSQPVSSVLDSLGNNLQAQKQNFRTRFLFVAQAPEESSIVVTKYAGGDAAQATVLAHDATNGWTYAGLVSNVFAIDSPIPMNQSSGYAIELHGSAKLLGDDTANVSFKPSGAQDSTSH